MIDVEKTAYDLALIKFSGLDSVKEGQAPCDFEVHEFIKAYNFYYEEILGYKSLFNHSEDN